MGGMYAITTALHGLAEDLGVRFHFRSPWNESCWRTTSAVCAGCG